MLKGVVKLLSAPSVEETTPVFAMRALVVVSYVVTFDNTFDNRVSK